VDSSSSGGRGSSTVQRQHQQHCGAALWSSTDCNALQQRPTDSGRWRPSQELHCQMARSLKCCCYEALMLLVVLQVPARPPRRTFPRS
jgi:hypothetical protein